MKPRFRGDTGGDAVQEVRAGAAPPKGGWLRAIREAQGVAQTELAAKLGFKRQAWAQFEASEAREAISLASLRRAADALGCDLVYSVVPRAARERRRRHPGVGQRASLAAGSGDEKGGAVSRMDAIPAAGPSVDVVPSAWPELELPTELK